MNKRIMPADRSTDYFGMIICGALFICGCIAGTVSAGYSVGGSALSDYFSLVGEMSGRPVTFFSALLNESKYHLATVFFGFSVLGVICVPALSAVRGFFLCFSVSAIVRHFGAEGVPLALAIFGIGALLSMPCFFILSVQSLKASLYLLKSASAIPQRGILPYGSAFFRRIVLCSAVISISAILDCSVVPKLIAFTAEHIT